MANPNPSNQWKKGQSGNPAGATKKENRIADIIEMAGRQIIDKKERWTLLAEVMFKAAIDNGDMNVARYLIDRRYGKPKETVDANLKGDINITINKIVDE